MRKQLLRRLLFGAVILAVAISGGSIHRRYQQDMALAYQRIASGGKLIETACGPIQYTEFGAGPPLLMVHGAGGGYDQGEYFAKVIGGNYHWIAPSRFGFLGTPAPDGADSVRQVETHACLLDALGIEQVGVVGVSMGGPSALLFAQLDLLDQGCTAVKRAQLAEATGIPRPFLLPLIHQADLSRLAYVRGKTVRHLCGGGYDTLAKLASADLQEMEAAMSVYYQTVGKRFADYKSMVPLAPLVGGARSLPKIVAE